MPATPEAIQRACDRRNKDSIAYPCSPDMYGQRCYKNFTSECDREQEFSDALRRRVASNLHYLWTDFLVPPQVDPVKEIVHEVLGRYYPDTSSCFKSVEAAFKSAITKGLIKLP